MTGPAEPAPAGTAGTAGAAATAGGEYRQPSPICIQVEPTEGCNLRCGFCGIRGIRDAGPRGELSGPYQFMPLEVAASLAQQVAALGWNPRLEVAMHGEPTLHPDLPGLVRMLRLPLPKVSILLTANAIPTLDRPGGFSAAADALFDAGVNTIAVDDYRPHPVRPFVRAYARRGVLVGEYPAGGPAFNPNTRLKATQQRLVLVEDISQADQGTHSTLSNHAGCAAPPDPEAKGRCALPFREMSVRWDGSVALCCNDWRGVFKVGHVVSDGLDSIWHHPAMYAARRRLLAGRRDFKPCQGCTHRSYRVGLLPDGRGGSADALGAPAAGDSEVLAGAVAGPSLTVPVLRKWELPVVEVK